MTKHTLQPTILLSKTGEKTGVRVLIFDVEYMIKTYGKDFVVTLTFAVNYLINTPS